MGLQQRNLPFEHPVDDKRMVKTCEPVDKASLNADAESKVLVPELSVLSNSTYGSLAYNRTHFRITDSFLETWLGKITI